MRRTLGHPIRAGSWVLGMFSRPVRKYSRDSEEILSCSVTGEKLWVARVAKTRWPCVNRSGLEGSTRGDGEEFAALRWGGQVTWTAIARVRLRPFRKPRFFCYGSDA